MANLATVAVPSFAATIYVGLKHRESGEAIAKAAAVAAIQAYVNAVGLCVSVTDTEFVYVNGRESGMAVELINYPRFPSTPDLIKAHALAIGEMLLKCCRQLRVSIVMPAETVMIGVNVA